MYFFFLFCFSHTVTGKAAKPVIEALPSKLLRGVVEFVYSGSRFKVSIPSEGIIIIQANVAQVRCPLGSRGAAAAGGARAGEPFSEEARVFAKEQLYQRAVRFLLNFLIPFHCILFFHFL